MRFAVIGSPVAHSRSPAMHEAAYRALGLPHSYEKLETAAEELLARVDALRSGELAGINVTVPHKHALLAHVDMVAPTAAAVGAANTLVRGNDGRITAHNTDALALAEEIVRLQPAAAPSLRGASAVVIGSGGAARAAVYALGALGFARVTVRARTEPPSFADVFARGAASNASASAPSSDSSARAQTRVVLFEPLDGPRVGEREDLRAIVQCTTAAMHGGPPGHLAVDAVDWSSVPVEAVAYDVVYSSGATPFLAAAAARGLVHADGLGMLVAQGALAFELWLGVAPPRDVMRAAVASSAR